MNTPAILLNPQPRVLTDIQIPSIDISGNGGLGWADLKDPKKGVAMFALMPAGISSGDYIELFWDNKVVQNFLADPDRPTIDFSILPEAIPDLPEIADVFYRITTGVGGNADDSPIRKVLVKRSSPGNPDPDNTTPYLNENLPPLEGVPPDIETATDLSLTVPAWEHMHEDDVLRVFWGGSQFSTENPPLPAVEIGKPQTVIITAATQQAAGDDDNLIVNYEVRDLVNNWSLYSLPVLSNVVIDPLAPRAPRVIEANQSTRELDLAVLGDNDVHVLIPAGVEQDDTITLHWLGEASGVPVVPVIAPQVVDDPAFPPQFSVPNADVLAIAGGLAKVFFKLRTPVGEDHTSRSVTVTVIGQPSLLKPPAVDEASGSALDPALIPSIGATVRIKPYAGKGFGDVAYLQWEGSDSGGAPVLFNDEYSVGRNEETVDITFTVQKFYAEALAGSTLTVSYKIRFFNGAWKDSDPASYTVVGSLKLPKPTVDHAVDDVFDPDLNPSGTNVHVAGASAALKRSDEVTVSWSGVPGSGSNSKDFLVSTDNQNLRWSIPATLVEANRDRVVNVSYRVVRAAGGTQNSDVVVLHIQPAVAPKFPAPEVSEASDGVLDPMHAITGATVVVAYEDMQTTDSISPSFDGRTDVATPPSQAGSTAGTVSFTLSAAAIARALGKTVDVLYSVQRSTNPLDSDALALTVRPLPSSALEAPRIAQAPDDQTLDVGRLTVDPDLTVKAWPFIAVGQRIWLRFEGTQNDGTAYNWNHVVWQNHAIPDTANQAAKVHLKDLQKLKAGTHLKLIFEVSFDGGTTRTAFPVRTLTIAAAGPVTGFESWETFPLQTLPLNQPIDCSNGLKLTVSGAVAATVNVNPAYPAFGDRTLQTAASCALRLDFGGLIKALSLSHAGAEAGKNAFVFYDAQNIEVQRTSITSGSAIVAQTITLSRACAYCIATLTGDGNGMLIDNLIWTG